MADIGVSVHDLDSTNGTFINRQRAGKGMLHNGDVLTLGDIDFNIEVPEVQIALPEMHMAEAPGAAFLGDGTPACRGQSRPYAFDIPLPCTSGVERPVRLNAG